MRVEQTRADALKTIHFLKEQGIAAYPERFKKEQDLLAVASLAVGQKVSTAGRLVSIRTMGKITFCHLQDYSGKMQIAIRENEVGPEQYHLFNKIFSIGDFLGVKGGLFLTKTGEKTIAVAEYAFLGKALNVLPEKWQGLKNQETRYRQRYLDLIANRDSMEIFLFRSRLISAIREFYGQEGFLEVETPVFLHHATGAVANPYKTHHDALGIDLSLRISHELPLKTLVVGGFEKIFELGKAFRNEGLDPSHLPEHTHLEHYAAYWNYEDNIRFTEKMFAFLFEKLGLPYKIQMQEGVEVDFSFPWKSFDFLELVREKTGIDLLVFTEAAELRSILRKKGIEFEDMEEASLAGLMDNMYKKVIRPKLINPTFLVHYPRVCQPLARKNDQDERVVDQFQLVVNGWEIVKAYSELVDPVDQEERFREQQQGLERGESEVMDVDEEYLKAMSYGMPPISGLGMGLDRLTALLRGKSNLRDVVLFPLLRE